MGAGLNQAAEVGPHLLNNFEAIHCVCGEESQQTKSQQLLVQLGTIIDQVSVREHSCCCV